MEDQPSGREIVQRVLQVVIGCLDEIQRHRLLALISDGKPSPRSHSGCSRRVVQRRHAGDGTAIIMISAYTTRMPNSGGRW